MLTIRPRKNASPQLLTVMKDRDRLRAPRNIEPQHWQRDGQEEHGNDMD